MADREYIGALHIHTSFSDGHYPACDVVRIAAQVGLDYVVICDHGSDGTREAGLVGWHGRTLCLSAPEVGRRGNPHFMSFGLRDLEAVKYLKSLPALEGAAAQGATNFVAHPHAAEITFFRKKPVGWNEWSTTAFSGIEIWSYLHDICHKIVPWRLAYLITGHTKLICGPRPETLALWDRLCQKRRVAGLGSLDNHATKLPIVGEMLPHAELFRALRTHVICPELPADGLAAERALAAALASGRAFVAGDCWGDSTGFTMHAEGPSGLCQMGQEMPFAAGAGKWVLRVRSPLTAQLTVVRDGAVIDVRESCSGFELALNQPGVYRVEGRLGGKPWVFTNPVYLRGKDHGENAG